MINKTFYPTPKSLIARMVAKIQNKDAKAYLDPSAGKGDIIDYLKDIYKYRIERIDAIEIDETLQATLKGKSVHIVDSDFLQFAGADKYDVILMNPPFDTGHMHLLKAINIMYCGEIICLLNAQTLKNPNSKHRDLLARKLNELDTGKVLSTYFEISAFKKGTIHLIFRDEDILRRFNITACKGKN